MPLFTYMYSCIDCATNRYIIFPYKEGELAPICSACYCIRNASEYIQLPRYTQRYKKEVSTRKTRKNRSASAPPNIGGNPHTPFIMCMYERNL